MRNLIPLHILLIVLWAFIGVVIDAPFQYWMLYACYVLEQIDNIFRDLLEE